MEGFLSCWDGGRCTTRRCDVYIGGAAGVGFGSHQKIIKGTYPQEVHIHVHSHCDTLSSLNRNLQKKASQVNESSSLRPAQKIIAIRWRNWKFVKTSEDPCVKLWTFCLVPTHLLVCSMHVSTEVSRVCSYINEYGTEMWLDGYCLYCKWYMSP